MAELIQLGRGYVPTEFRIGDRVRLSKLGVWRLIAWPVKGRLNKQLKRRSTYNRKLTDMSVGTVVGDSRSAVFVVKWDELKDSKTIAKRFLTLDS